MRIKIIEDHATDRLMYWVGRVYEVPDNLGQRWINDGIAMPAPEPVRRIRRKQSEEEE